MASQQLQTSLVDDKALEVHKTASSSQDASRSGSVSTSAEPQPQIDPDIEHGIPIIDTTQDADVKEARARMDCCDANVVDWESPEDPLKAVNWTPKKKWANISIISCVTFLTPLASSMIAPAIPLILKDLGSQNTTIGSFIVSIYILGYALGPLVIAPMSEIYGRLPMYHVCNTLFLIWSVACALAPNIGSLLVFRLLAGIFGSCPITIGAGSIADVFIPQQRGLAMSLFSLGPLMGPVLGPVCGGYLSEAAGWRWNFWLITIAAGVCLTGSIIFMRETFEPVLLQERVDKLRKETGNTNLRSKLAPTISKKEHFTRSIVRPTKMLLFSPIVTLFSIYMAVVYGYLYLLFTTLTLVYERVYNFSQGSVGLTFLGIGVGSLLGLAAFGIISDKLLKQMTAKHGAVKPEFRLPPLIPGSFLIPIGFFWYGWSADKHIHWIMPIIGTGFVGVGMLATFMAISTYLVDAFNIHAASAIAANTVLRSLVGAFLPLAGPKMYQTLGLGWGNSLLAFIALALLPIPLVFYQYGERIRTSQRFQVKF